jgi:hypothetical protein
MSVIGAVYQRIANDPVIQTLSGGRVSTNWAAEDGIDRLVIGVDFQQIPGNNVMRTGTITISIVTRDNNIERLELVRDRVEAIIDGQILSSDDTQNTLRLFLAGEALEPQSDTQITIWSMTFNCRYLRHSALSGDETATS